MLQSFQSLGDTVVITAKRILAIHVQGIPGKKKDFTSTPYSKIQVFSVETVGTFDLDAELEVFISSMGKIKFESMGHNDIRQIVRFISERVL